MVKLAILTGPRAGETIEIDGERVIGRSNADITIEDPKLSRRHAALRPVEGGLEVTDLGSLNGTMVGDERITETVRLTAGERLRLGDTTARVEVEAASEPTQLDQATAGLGATVIASSEPTAAAPVADAAPAPVVDAAPAVAAVSAPPPPRVDIPAPASPPDAFAPPGPGVGRVGPRHAATLLWGPTAASVAIIVATAIAEVVYFAAR